MKRYICHLVSLLMIWSLSLSVLAVDENRIWLPKKYASAKPKLLATAKEAEATERCNKVVSGEIISRRTTQDHYYFLITCRDENQRTYNLGYLHPITGNTPELVMEQRSKNAPQKTEVEIEEGKVTTEQVITLCRDEFAIRTDEYDDVQLLEQDSLPSQQGDDYVLHMPFTAISSVGSSVDYKGICHVTVDGKASVDISLLRTGALAICLDNHKAESILLGRATVIEEAIESLPVDESEGFRFSIPFDAKTVTSSLIRYSAICDIDPDGVSEITMFLQPEGALTLCKDGLRLEAFMMKAVEIVEDPALNGVKKEGPEGAEFNFLIPFTANDPDGNTRNFNASCLVNADGEAVVETALDKSSILDVCENGVIDETEKMLDVVVLKNEIPELIEDEEGYMGIIPFNARNPSGRELHYQGMCRVSGNGQTSIKIQPRKK